MRERERERESRGKKGARGGGGKKKKNGAELLQKSTAVFLGRREWVCACHWRWMREGVEERLRVRLRAIQSSDRTKHARGDLQHHSSFAPSFSRVSLLPSPPPPPPPPPPPLLTPTVTSNSPRAGGPSSRTPPCFAKRPSSMGHTWSSSGQGQPPNWVRR